MSGRSEPALAAPAEPPPATMPPMKPATADLTRVSMLGARRGGAPRLPLPGWPPSSAALVDDRLAGEGEAAAAEQEEEEEEEEEDEEEEQQQQQQQEQQGEMVTASLGEGL